MDESGIPRQALVGVFVGYEPNTVAVVFRPEHEERINRELFIEKARGKGLTPLV
jgi:hypothetical protein